MKDFAMYIVLTARDLAKLSAHTREELQRYIFQGTTIASDEALPYDYNFDDIPYQEFDDEAAQSWPEAPIVSSDSKVVIDISPEQARSLIANLSAKSVEVLRRFASGETVALNDLVGAGKFYESFGDLKRSFVGAVNRRLRTVTRNRSAVLFRKEEGSEGTGIAVRPMTASALQQVLLEDTPKPDGLN